LKKLLLQAIRQAEKEHPLTGKGNVLVEEVEILKMAIAKQSCLTLLKKLEGEGRIFHDYIEVESGVLPSETRHAHSGRCRLCKLIEEMDTK
jgi:hypothetical protein